MCGLTNKLNEVIADFSYNSRKGDRFVPYRVCDYPPPVTFGDVGEFLIRGGWIVCEFGGPEWWEESTPGCTQSTNGKKSCTPNMELMQSHPNTKRARQECIKKLREEYGEQSLKAMQSHPNTLSNRSEQAHQLNKTKWRCTVTGHVSSAGSLSNYQKRRGINTKNRIRVNYEKV